MVFICYLTNKSWFAEYISIVKNKDLFNPHKKLFYP